MLADPSNIPIEFLASSLVWGTHYYRHPSALHSPAEKMQSSQYLPSRFPLLFPSNQDDNIRNKDHALNDDGERDEETDGAPHGAEIPVAMTVFLVGKVIAGFGERGTAAMKAIGVVNLFAAGLRGKVLVMGL